MTPSLAWLSVSLLLKKIILKLRIKNHIYKSNKFKTHPTHVIVKKADFFLFSLFLLTFFCSWCILIKSQVYCCLTYGGIAQLARVLGSYPIGRWFKSYCRYHYGPLVKRLRHRPFTAESWVQFPYGSPYWCYKIDAHRKIR